MSDRCGIIVRMGMKRVVRVKLLPSAGQFVSLTSTLTTLNLACDALSDVAWSQRVFGARTLQKAHYQDLKAMFGLAAQPALHVLKKTADAYKLDTKTKRRFSKHGAIAFDDRCLSWQIPESGNTGTVSIWTVDGRMKNVTFVGREEDVQRLRDHRDGETDLFFDGENFYLSATLDIPAPEANITPETATTASDWLGVDLGIVNIAVTSDGETYAGKKLNTYREHQISLRAELQKKGTKAAKRRLKARRRKEARHASHINHTVAKRIVAEAQRTGRGISLENLAGIRHRARLRKPQRTKLNSWGFHQLGQYIQYKAEQGGVTVVFIDPAYTSQQCAPCGHIDKRNRPTQATFTCTSCNVRALSADHNAAQVIAARAPAEWAAINQPELETAHAA